MYPYIFCSLSKNGHILMPYCMVAYHCIHICASYMCPYTCPLEEILEILFVVFLSFLHCYSHSTYKNQHQIQIYSCINLSLTHLIVIFHYCCFPWSIWYDNVSISVQLLVGRIYGSGNIVIVSNL